MTPFHYIHNIENMINSMDSDLRDINDNKAQVLSKLKEILKMLNTLRDNVRESMEKQKQEQNMFCDELKIEFSVNSDFSNSYTRNYEAVCLSMETLKTIIYGERMLQNDSNELLFARVFITDTDPES